MAKRNKLYFMSDAHLGAPNFEESLKREKLLVQWLVEVSQDAKAIYLLGDIFDYWFEYKHVVPRGFSRFLGKVSELVDSGVEIHFFTGNHDIWVFDYLGQETGMIIHKKEEIINFDGKTFFLSHGDGLGRYDKKFKFLKRIFTSKFNQFFYKKIHPDLTIGFAYRWSKISRKKHDYDKKIAMEDEWLVQFSKEYNITNPEIDYYIYGHRHIPYKYEINDNTSVLNIGDWLINFTYVVYSEQEIQLKRYLETKES